jgi:hypothetical protein
MRKFSRAAVSAGALASAVALGGVALTAVPASAATTSNPAASALRNIRPGTPLKVAGGQRPGTSALSGGLAPLQSANWSGYAAAGRTTTFRWIAAKFKVPAVNCSGVTATTGTWSGHWIGLDGFVSQTVEQVGVISACLQQTTNGPFVAEYFPFWEMAPNQAYSPPKVTVHAGDSVSASVYYDRYTHVFTLSFADTTDGKHFVRTATCPSGVSCKRNSAEAISEPPLINIASNGDLTFAPLADFGSEKFGSVSITTTKGHHGGFKSSYWNAYRIEEVASKNNDGTPMNYNAQGQGITAYGSALDIPSYLSHGDFTNAWQKLNG